MAYWKARCPYVLVDVTKGVNVCFEDERRLRVGRWLEIIFCKYMGVSLCLHLYAIVKSLKLILYLTGNQCKSYNTGVMWSRLRLRETILAAQFWTLWTLSMRESGKPNNKLLQLSILGGLERLGTRNYQLSSIINKFCKKAIIMSNIVLDVLTLKYKFVMQTSFTIMYDIAKIEAA